LYTNAPYGITVQRILLVHIINSVTTRVIPL